MSASSKPRVKPKSSATSSTQADPATEEEELTCSPCQREGRKVEATKFCEDCAEHLCEKCVHDHKKFVVTKDHRITGKQKPVSEGPKQELIEKCSSHQGKVLELFCADHDDLCCSVCVAVGHRGCSNVVYIPQAAVGVESGMELMEVKQSVQRVKSDIDDLRRRRGENQQLVQQQKEDIVNAILDMRIRVSQLLDTLERQARKELQTRYNELITNIDIDVKNCDDISTTLGGLATKLETTQNSEAELFVWLKKAKKSMHEGECLETWLVGPVSAYYVTGWGAPVKCCNRNVPVWQHYNLSHAGLAVVYNIGRNLGRERLTFMEDRTLENVLVTMTTLGEFGAETHVYRAQFEGEHNFSLSSDIGSSEDNTGSVALPDGKLILTNAHHKRLKLLSPTYRVIDHVDLPGKPYDVCLAGPSEVITSLREEKQLQFVSVDKSMKLSRTMKLGVACYGVACNNGEIYTACIGGQYENRPQIRVYNMSGRMLRAIERGTDGNQIFSTPRNIAVSPDGTLLHVTDREYGVLTLGLYGKVMSVYKGHELDSPRGITVDSDGNLFVCGQNSHNVVQLNSAGDAVVGQLLKDRVNFHRPQSLCLVQRKHRSLLVVTFCKSKFLKVYALA